MADIGSAEPDPRFNSEMARAYAGCPSTWITRGRWRAAPDNAKRRKSLAAVIPLRGQHEIDRVASRINGSVQVRPGSGNLYIGLIHPPETIGAPQFAPKALIQQRWSR